MRRSLDPNFLGPSLQVLSQVRRIHALVRPRNNPRRVLEQIVHLLQRQQLRLGQGEEEVDGVGKVEDDEDHVEFPPDTVDGRTRDLADHGVEGERDHGGDAHAFGARVGIEDLGGNDEGEGAAGR